MARSGRRRRSKANRRGPIRSGLAAAGQAIVRRPVVTGGLAAFTITFLFVTANAIWYQPHPHRSAFFQTRERPAWPWRTTAGESIIQIKRDLPAPDPTVERVQKALARLDLYTGAIDGIAGPQTQTAVKDYQRIAGIEASGAIDERLAARLERGADTRPAMAVPRRPAVAVPAPAPRPSSHHMAEKTASVRSAPQPRPALPIPDAETGGNADPRIVRIQAGLRAFGNDAVEIDGVAGAKTKAAIREFQSLFGLPVTGEPDERLYAKMQEIGLTN
jgi:peptidoglycan hydrolase-like protein with peptidoglycan-binding domain